MVSFDYAAQPKVEIRECNLCGGTRFKPFAEEDRFGLPVETVKCRSCELVFINPRMTREAYAKFYRDGIYRKLLGTGHHLHSMEVWQRRYADKLPRYLDEPMKKRKAETMLDIGGSTGVVAEVISRRYGLTPTVMEPSDDEALAAEARGIEVIRSTIEDYEPDGRRWDLILLCQTIDHLTDIAGSLKTIRALLEDRALFFVDVVWSTPIKVDHPFYLDEYTAPRFLRQAGFRILYERRGKKRVRLNYVCEKG